MPGYELRVLFACCGLAVLGCDSEGRGGPLAERTQVLVVATVHGQHRRNPNYRYVDVVRILDTFAPDLVCVEIRPEDFRRQPYLKEMMLATVWGIVHETDLCGFDWYDDTARETRARLEADPTYAQQARVFDSLVTSNPITGSFEDRYGDYWSGTMGYRFYNGPAYNRYFEEWYRLSLAVFGDSPINLYYESRNRRMMELAWEAMRRHRGGKVALLTGAEHKHYFDRDLAARESVFVVDLERLLPLVGPSMDPAIRAFLEDADDLLYYEPGYPVDTNRYYQGKLTELVHGPDMDWRPDIIPAENVAAAGKVLARWRRSQGESYRMVFDLAWFLFLSHDCEAAIERASSLIEAVRTGLVDDPFVRVYSYRNLGLCHDLLGNRQEALRSYARARALAQGTATERSVELMLRDYESVPYRRGRSKEPWRRNQGGR